MKQTRRFGDNSVPIQFPNKKNRFKESIKTKINKWNIARQGKHELGLRRIARHQRSGINFETINNLIKPKYNKKTISFLDKTFENGCVIILNNDDFLKLKEDDEIDQCIKERLGSNKKVSSIVFINDINALNMMKPIIKENNWSELEKTSNNNSGNEHWKGQYAIVIRGGIKTPIEKGKIQLFNMDYDYASKETEIAIEAQMTLMLLKSTDPEKLLTTPNDLKEIKLEYTEYCNKKSLNDMERLIKLKILNEEFNLLCPICGRRIHADDLLGNCERNNDVELLHLNPLESGKFNHAPYNLGLGCHMCNSFQGEYSISDTVEKARKIVQFHEK